MDRLRGSAGQTFHTACRARAGLLSCRGVVLATLGGPSNPRTRELTFFLGQMRARWRLLGAETATEVVADSLDVDPSQTESLLATACEGQALSASTRGEPRPEQSPMWGGIITRRLRPPGENADTMGPTGFDRT